MSEYQYYEFQAVDRPLTVQEQSEIHKLSSRVQLTATQAIFLYHYGSFRGEAAQVLAQYFDMMFYIANWGSWQLIFRFPKAIVDAKWFQPYELEGTITVSTTSQHVILDIHIVEEEGLRGWVEGSGWLSRLLPLRDELILGDLRLLYLVWLRTAPYLAEHALDEDPIEPSIPANLDKLSQPLQAFVELVELDPDWVAAAAQASPHQPAIAEPPLETWLSQLSASEQREFLLKLLRQEPRVDLQLISRLKQLAGQATSPPATSGHRRLSELAEIAESLSHRRQQKAQNAARKKRIQQLEALAPKVAQTWTRVVDLIELKQAKPYDEATALLQDLCDLANHQGNLPEFTQRFEQLKSTYQSRPALLARFSKIKLH